MANAYSDTPKEVGENIKNILSEEQLLEMEKNGTVPPNEEFFTPEDDFDRDKAMILNWIYPVGIILEFAEEVDPNALMPGQRWKEFGAGRVTIGAGSYTDKNAKSLSWTVGEEDTGEYQHKLEISEMPSHSHELDMRWQGAGVGNYWRQPPLTAEGGTHYISNRGQPVHYEGGDQPHNNVQPYVVVKRWKRVS